MWIALARTKDSACCEGATAAAGNVAYYAIKPRRHFIHLGITHLSGFHDRSGGLLVLLEVPRHSDGRASGRDHGRNEYGFPHFKLSF